MKKIKRALISVFDKTGIEELARHLVEFDIDIISSGGTAKVLQEAGISTTPVESLTAYPEMLDGRVKTLHPAIFGGILAEDTPQHVTQLQQQNIEPIDLVIVNLYPFEETVNCEDYSPQEAIEKIDIGGPSLIRAAAKNFKHKTVILSPDQYKSLMAELSENQGATSDAFRMDCAARVFRHTARYNALIAAWFEKQSSISTLFPDDLTIQARKIQDLRYGENPHQQAAFYTLQSLNPLHDFKKLHGKELSYNNILDLDAALSAVQEFENPAAVIVKHSNPCGAARDEHLLMAYKKALETDPLSAFGGIVGLNRPLDTDLAQIMYEHFFECIIAPGYSAEALQILQKKKNLRLLQYFLNNSFGQNPRIRSVSGGLLIQTSDIKETTVREARVVTKRKPTEAEWQSLEFGWTLIKHVHSNAIIFSGDNQLIGVGAGQMSRVDAAELAITKANKAGHSLQNTVVASDAFFPFKDSVEAIAKAGATAVIQPGGSIRDEEVIEAADRHNLAMVFTAIRHFKH